MEQFETQDVYGREWYFKRLQHVTCLGMAILRNDAAAVETSLGKGCDVNSDKTTDYWDNPFPLLIMACGWSSLPVVSLLVEQPGIEIDRMNRDDETALAWAVRNPENVDMVKLLVEAGADISWRDGEENSLLHQAAKAGAVEIASMMVKHPGIKIDCRNDEGETALSWAVRKPENLDMVNLLVEAGADICLLEIPVFEEIIRILKEAGAKVQHYIYYIKGE